MVRGKIFAVCDKIGPTGTVISLPTDFLDGTTNAIQGDTFCPRGNIDYCPIFCGSVVGLTNVSTICVTTSIVICFLPDVTLITTIYCMATTALSFSNDKLPLALTGSRPNS